ncbi:protein-tyrosine phosphatase family protein [Nonomuraea soli]|uniref:Protein-tyrosine phosphatase n=1 Tax=Nonomuraea soli TaxID=1032476 RepID=A0A7W0CLC2_9ACTN|nr:protein-tyrosine phosphatase family protein [Nonomuraea soli]MBA2893174.1 protein-tyrosine phosphatase [Nonomuraea soli]
MKVVELPDGARVRGRGLRRSDGAAEPVDYGLYLAPFEPAWEHSYLRWPDFWVPSDPDRAVALIRDLHARALAGQRVEVACGGGIGRTGTVIACLAVLSGIPRADAVAWTRAHYHRRAVETPWQRRWIARVT